MVYHKDKTRILSNPALMVLTNKFIKDFMELSATFETSKDKEFLNSYAFNYQLTECLVNSDYLDNKKEEPTYALLGMGFSDNIMTGFFERTLTENEIDEKIRFILTNFDCQDEYDDYLATKLTITTVEIDVEELDIDVIMGHKIGLAKYIVKKPQVTHQFRLSNSKSGYVGFVKYITVGGEPNKILVYGKDSKDLQLDISLRFDLDPKILNYDRIKDINGFYHMVNQVYYGIQINMKKDLVVSES